MRICQVVASWGDGGLEKHVTELCNALCERHELALIGHTPMQPRLDPRITFIPVDFSLPRWSPRLYKQLFNALRSWPADIVHTQANKAASMVGRLRPWAPAQAFVATLHNQKGSTRMYDRFDQVIVVSPGIAKLVRKAPVTAIYNGIRKPAPVADGRQMLAREFGFDAGAPILVAVGRLVEAKGFDILIPAAAQAGVQLLILGDGPERAELERAVQQTGARVVLAGFRPDAQTLMAAADGFVLSSRNEGFAYVFVEALLAERPILATDIPMVGEFMPRELIVPVADVKALAAGLTRVVADLEGWRRLMAPAFAKAEAELTLEAMVGKTEQVYQRALRRP